MTARVDRLLGRLEGALADSLLVSSWPNVTYLSGFRGTESWLLVAPQARYFITDSRYAEQARAEAKGFKVILRDTRSVAQIVADLRRKHGWSTVAFEADTVTHFFYLGLERQMGRERLRPTRNLVEGLRLKKDAGEIEKLRRSARIAVEGFRYLSQTLHPGMTELEAQARLEHYTKTIGSEKPAFEIIIAAGERASMPHCQSDRTRIRKDQPVLVDMGVVYEGYHSDLTRPILLGKMNASYRKVNRIVREAQAAGIRRAGPGVPASEVDRACRDWIRRRGYGSYFGHGTGHGVGLEIHEAPSVSASSQTILEPGMVITVEPGIYLPGRLGVRIEDMVLITPKGREVLTEGLDDPGS